MSSIARAWSRQRDWAEYSSMGLYRPRHDSAAQGWDCPAPCRRIAWGVEPGPDFQTPPALPRSIGSCGLGLSLYE